MDAEKREKNLNTQFRDREECYICGAFCAPYRIKAHILNHTDAKIYECEECGARLHTRGALSQHMKGHKDYRYICQVCNKKFEDSDGLENHTCSRQKERKHSCDICLKGFYSKYDLTRHVRSHTNDKPYTCEVCKRGFTQKGNRDSHLRSHYQTEKSKPKDKQFVCEICFQSFGYKQHLKRHYVVHMDEKPYECKICHKRFTQNSYLKIHNRIHTNERPYKCDLCDRGFHCKWKLKCHYTSKHHRDFPDGSTVEKHKNLEHIAYLETNSSSVDYEGKSTSEQHSPYVIEGEDYNGGGSSDITYKNTIKESNRIVYLESNNNKETMAPEQLSKIATSVAQEVNDKKTEGGSSDMTYANTTDESKQIVYLEGNDNTVNKRPITALEQLSNIATYIADERNFNRKADKSVSSDTIKESKPIAYFEQNNNTVNNEAKTNLEQLSHVATYMAKERNFNVEMDDSVDRDKDKVVEAVDENGELNCVVKVECIDDDFVDDNQAIVAVWDNVTNQNPGEWNSPMDIVNKKGATFMQGDNGGSRNKEYINLESVHDSSKVNEQATFERCDMTVNKDITCVLKVREVVHSIAQGDKKLVSKELRTIKNSENAYACSVCKTPFQNKEKLECHMVNFVQNNRYKCCRCPAYYDSITRLLRHHEVHYAISPTTVRPCISFLEPNE